MNAKEKTLGGYFMLSCLVVMLTVPMVIGHFALAKDEPKVTVQADATHTQ